MTSASNPDAGTTSYTYDLNGNVTSITDARGSGLGNQLTTGNGVTNLAYDGLNRVLWRSPSTGPNATVHYTYDQTDSSHLNGIGRLTTETYTNGVAGTASNQVNGPSLSGANSYSYDLRGELTAFTQTAPNGVQYPFTFDYDDTGQPKDLIYSDGEQLSYGYSATGWLTSLITTLSGTSTNLATGITYNGVTGNNTDQGGLAGVPTGASIANGVYSYAASFDNDSRMSSTSLSLSSPSTTLFQVQPTYDGVGNVASVATILSTGTDNQLYCYDEQDRLTAASSVTGTLACGANTAGTLSSAAYSASYSYDTLDRISSHIGYTRAYGDPAHVHATTAIQVGDRTTYTAAYDAAGNLICRAPTAATTCAGSSSSWTGAVMRADNEGRLAHWQSAPGSSPATTDDYLYDCFGDF